MKVEAYINAYEDHYDGDIFHEEVVLKRSKGISGFIEVSFRKMKFVFDPNQMIDAIKRVRHTL